MKEIDALLARRLLIEIGVLTEVDSQDKGDAVAILTTEDMAAYEELTAQAQEIRTLVKLIKENRVRLNTKVLVHNARRDMWWNCLEASHGVTREQAATGLHVDRTSNTLRKGVLAGNPHGVHRT